jgi:hypothetical protein
LSPVAKSSTPPPAIILADRFRLSKYFFFFFSSKVFKSGGAFLIGVVFLYFSTAAVASSLDPKSVVNTVLFPTTICGLYKVFFTPVFL